MKLTTKLAASSALLVVLLIAVLSYDLSVVHRLAAAQEELTGAEQKAVTISLEQRRLLDRLDELTRKLFVTRDPDYAEGVLEIRGAFDRHLQELKSLELSTVGAEAVDALSAQWQELPLGALAEQAIAVEPGTEEEELLLTSFVDLSAALRSRADGVISAAEETVLEHVRRSALESRNARTFSWIAALSALALSLPIIYFTLASIREPLRRLDEGARSVARGEYTFRIDDDQHDEFSELAFNFNEMIRSLDRRDRRGRDLLSHLSHELKTPLVAMHETNRLLLDKLPGPLTAKQERLLELNLESGHRLSEMIEKLLDSARLEDGLLRYELDSHDLVALASRSIEAFSARAADARVTLTLSAEGESVPAVCDGDRIGQVLANLVDNAIKFAPAGSTVTVHVATVAGDDAKTPRTAVIEVGDQGPGIPEADKEAIFERFRQLEGAKRSGVGLGLAISRQIARAHRGSLTVHDNADGGSTFSLMLPTTLAASERLAAEVGG